MTQAFRASLPIVIGYVALGVPCGILGAAVGMGLFQVLLLSVLMYSGSGQYMIPNMFLAGVPMASISATVTLVSSRHLLYGSALSPYFQGVSKLRLVFFAATVTDESFGVNLMRFQTGRWTPVQAQAVNTFSHMSWIISNALGVLLGAWLMIDTSIAAFAMTAIFLCLLFMQKFSFSHVAAAVMSVIGVIICKLVGLEGVAILVGALSGILMGVISLKISGRTSTPGDDGAEEGGHHAVE